MDGQQRLTTLTVILSYLNEYELINEKLQYNVRKETEEFLKEYIFKPNELKNIQNWEQFLENTSIKGKDYDYQDVFYLFKAYKEDLEHIFPQTPVGDRIKDKIKQTQILKEYIDIINQSLSEEEKININDCDIDWENQNWKDDIKFRINNRIEKVIPVNSLGNMCVLHESVNRGYGNDFFLEKRIDIMRKSQEGFFIRPHVYDAFNKIFLERHDESIDMKMMNRWDRSDILARREYIIKRISNFLNTSNEQA